MPLTEVNIKKGATTDIKAYVPSIWLKMYVYLMHA